ncbi:TonB-dependent receptor domain-containing protein [Sphingomonas sp. CJ99]
MRLSRLLTATALASVAFTLPQVALAQDTPAVGDPAQTAADEDEEETTNDIVVTGTRIRLPNLTSPEPITTLDNAQLRERNFTNIADALNELPGVRGSVTPAGAQGFGQGTNFINNYGLGSNRTLTLINGRRFVSSNVATIFNNAGAGTQVDLNTVPSILVDRIDTISVGGAPLYGSDAISGTILVQLRSKYEGVELQATTGITQEGDNGTYNFSGIAGKTFLDGRLNITIAGQHDNVDGVVYNDREFLRRRIGGATNPTSAQGTSLRPGLSLGASNDGRVNPNIGFNNSQTDGNPGTVLIRQVNIPFLTPGGLITATNLTTADPRNPAVPFGVATTRGLQFAPDGSLIPFNQGVVFPGTSGSGGQGFTFADYTQITSDLRRTTLNGFLTFEFTPGFEFFAEGTFFKSRADELTQQPTFNSSLFGGLSGALTYSVDNPFLTQQARDALVSRGVTRFQVSRASDDFADLTGFNDTEIYFGTAGIRGDINALGTTFNFEVYGSHGRTRSQDNGQDLNAQNFINAVNVARDVNGNIVCTTAPTVGTGFAAPGGTPIADPNCRPLNVFGRFNSDPAARDYVIEEFSTVSIQEQTVFNANIGGALFDLWGAGAAGFNVGYEYRREFASFTPSSFQQEGRGRSVAITPLSGSYQLHDVFGEVVLPIISPENDIPLLHRVQAFGRGRYSDNSINGGFFAYTAGGTIAPVEDIAFRGNITRSFRSPAITELFLPEVNTFQFVADLCQDASIRGGPVPTIRERNCNAFRAAFPGTDYSTPDPASTASVPARAGGNPNLQNEEANSYTFGVIIEPRFIPRLSLAVDYVNIELTGPIANLTVPQIVSGCFDNETFDASNVLNANAFCSLINRNPTTGRVVGDPQNPAVTAGFVNGQSIEFSGIQGTIAYQFPLFGGDLLLGGDAQFVERRLVDITGVAPAESHGVLGDPVLAGQLRIRYIEEDFGINTTINWQGQTLFSRLNRDASVPGGGPDARELDRLPGFATVSGGVFFDPTDNFRLAFSVTNLFNRQGYEYFGELHPSSFNDLLGRRFQASARVRF